MRTLKAAPAPHPRGALSLLDSHCDVHHFVGDNSSENMVTDGCQRQDAGRGPINQTEKPLAAIPKQTPRGLGTALDPS